jgi:hypothetical protein
MFHKLDYALPSINEGNKKADPMNFIHCYTQSLHDTETTSIKCRCDVCDICEQTDIYCVHTYIFFK